VDAGNNLPVGAAPGGGESVARPPDNAWVWQITLLSILLGGMLALAVRTTEQARNAPLAGRRPLQLTAAYLDQVRGDFQRLEQQNAALTARRDKYLELEKQGSRSSEELKQEFETIKALAGLTAVEGPGLNITISDSTATPPAGVDIREFMVHDTDLNGLLSELKAAGAQHLAISGADTERQERIILTTTARCVGPTAVVNRIPLSAPYHILAVGDPAALRAALEAPTGTIRVRELDTKKMVSIQEVEKLVLPEYPVTLDARYARPLSPEEELAQGF
jgi:uncharacterized protein YlxW (UPF0749 family)